MSEWKDYSRAPMNSTKGKQHAVALKYDPELDDAPRVIATGAGVLAEEILSLASEHKIPIHNDPLLVEALAGLDLDTVIPPELYKVVAEVFAFVVRVHTRAAAASSPPLHSIDR